MLGIILTFFGSLFSEISDSIGKRRVELLQQNVYAMGFLTFFWGAWIFLLIILIRGKFDFDLASWPTFGARLILEIIQAHITILAITRADRTTFGYIRLLTIPLLLLVDIFLGYQLSVYQMAGIVIIFLTLLAFSLDHKINKKGKWLVLASSLNAVMTMSLFKYNITYYNAVEAEQVLIYFALLSYFFAFSLYYKRQNPLLLLRNPACLLQSVGHGFSSILLSFAQLFAPASVIIAAKRASAVFWSTVSGYYYFKEKHLLIKLFFLGLLVFAIVLLAK